MADLKAQMEAAKRLLLEILDDSAYRTVPIIAADFQTEYPDEYLAFVKTYTDAYELHGCGYRRGFINGLTEALEEMEAQGQAENIHESGNVLWRKKT